jgi:hypothetical protein
VGAPFVVSGRVFKKTQLFPAKGLDERGKRPYIAAHEPGLSAGNGGFKRNFIGFRSEQGWKKGGPFALL